MHVSLAGGGEPEAVWARALLPTRLWLPGRSGRAFMPFEKVGIKPRPTETASISEMRLTTR